MCWIPLDHSYLFVFGHFNLSAPDDVERVTGLPLSDDIIPLIETDFLQTVSDPHQFVLWEGFQLLHRPQVVNVLVTLHLPAACHDRLLESGYFESQIEKI